MFKLIHKNRKGLSLVELLVTLVVLGLVIPLAGNILYNLINFNNVVIDRWDVQAAVKLVCGDFENNKDGLINAHQLDLLYLLFLINQGLFHHKLYLQHILQQYLS